MNVTVAQLLENRRQLVGISESAALDVELLLCHCLQKDRSYLKAWPEAEVDQVVVEQFLGLLQRRLQGEPIAYLIGSRGFWSFDLLTNASTLIPRPDTELLVEECLLRMAEQPGGRALDLGTGTGAIALALAAERPAWQLVGCDIESDAVQLAEQNRQRLQLQNVKLLQSNWFSQLPPQRFDLIASNPPYIDPDDPHLQQGDVRFEPRSALVAANQGFAEIETIICEAKAFLADGGWLLFEHGYNQAAGVQERLRAAGYCDVFGAKDLAGLDRVSGGRYAEKSH